MIDPVGRETVLVSHEHYDIAGKNLSRAKGRVYRLLFKWGERREQEARPADDTQHQRIPPPDPARLPNPVCRLPGIQFLLFKRIIVSVTTNI